MAKINDKRFVIFVVYENQSLSLCRVGSSRWAPLRLGRPLDQARQDRLEKGPTFHMSATYRIRIAQSLP